MTNPNDFIVADSEFKSDQDGVSLSQRGGLTKLEHFAGLAMQNMAHKNIGEYSPNGIDREDHVRHSDWVAQAAVFYAKALIKALNEEKSE